MSEASGVRDGTWRNRAFEGRAVLGVVATSAVLPTAWEMREAEEMQRSMTATCKR